MQKAAAAMLDQFAPYPVVVVGRLHLIIKVCRTHLSPPPAARGDICLDNVSDSITSALCSFLVLDRCETYVRAYSHTAHVLLHVRLARRARCYSSLTRKYVYNDESR